MDKKIFTVSETNSYIRDIMNRDYVLRNISVSGEISTLYKHRTGTYFFAIKDAKSEISCVMFADSVRNLKMDINNGDKVVVEGSVSLYEEKGRCQIYVRNVESFGLGDIYLQIEKLKRKLEAEGLFDISRKRALPKYPKSIGVVTSAGGAAIKDIVKIANERNDTVEILVYDSLVQGQGAPKALVAGLDYFSENGGVDLVIIGRGGGSIEDLMAFNDEEVARAIYRSKLPVMSAVGHERDVSISDLVADVRAATPSDASLIAVPDKAEIMNNLYNKSSILYKSMSNKIARLEGLMNIRASKIKSLSPELKLDYNNQKLLDKTIKLDKLMEIVFLKKEAELKSRLSKIEAVQPITNVKNGYVQIYKDDEKISSVKDLNAGDIVLMPMLDGDVSASITEVNVSNER